MAWVNIGKGNFFIHGGQDKFFVYRSFSITVDKFVTTE